MIYNDTQLLKALRASHWNIRGCGYKNPDIHTGNFKKGFLLENWHPGETALFCPSLDYPEMFWLATKELYFATRALADEQFCFVRECTSTNEDKDVQLNQNKEIRGYLKKNPVYQGIGKFGVPQDKYRYNFFGKKTMNFDIWRKNR